MTNVVNIVRHRPALSLGFAVLLLITTAGIVMQSGKCLKTKFAPRGIVSLELAWAQERADTIRHEWSKAWCNGNVIQINRANVQTDPRNQVTAKAKVNIADDIYFLFGYPIFFIICVILCDEKRNYSMKLSSIARLMIIFAISAGLLDAIENYFMWRFLAGNAVPSYSFALPATIKFALVLVLIIYIITYLVRNAVERIRG